MPKDVALTKDGFEDPDAFFKSPNNDVILRPVAKTPATAGGARTGARKGRLSALAGSDSGEEFEEDLLADEDELDAGGWSITSWLSS